MEYSVLLFITLIALRFFSAIPIPGFILFLLFGILSYKNVWARSLFKWQVILLMILCIVSTFTCDYFRHQAVFETLKQTSHYMMIFSYFFFIDKKIQIWQLEKLIYHLSILFVVCYLLQYFLYPYDIVIFPDAETQYSEEVRIRFAGQNICSLGFLFALNKYLTSGRRKYLFLAFFTFFTMFLWGFRTITFSCILFSLILFYKIRGIGYIVKIFPLLLLISIILLQTPLINEKIEFMQERQNSGETFANDDYIRVILIKYFYESHFLSNWELFWGSGLPADSSYGLYMDNLGENHLHWNDMGLLGLSWILGIPCVLTMIWYALKAGFQKMPKEYVYLALWFLFLLLIGFTTAEFIRIGNYVPQAIALALIAKIHNIKIK